MRLASSREVAQAGWGTSRKPHFPGFNTGDTRQFPPLLSDDEDVVCCPKFRILSSRPHFKHRRARCIPHLAAPEIPAKTGKVSAQPARPMHPGGDCFLNRCCQPSPLKRELIDEVLEVTQPGTRRVCGPPEHLNLRIRHRAGGDGITPYGLRRHGLALRVCASACGSTSEPYLCSGEDESLNRANHTHLLRVYIHRRYACSLH